MCKLDMSPVTLTDIFAQRSTPYHLLHPVSFRMRNKVYNCAETLSHLRPKIWSLVLHEINQYHLVILNQKSRNGLHLTSPADYAKNNYIKSD